MKISIGSWPHTSVDIRVDANKFNSICEGLWRVEKMKQMIVCPTMGEGLKVISAVSPKATIDKAIKKDGLWYIYFRLIE